jgi:8-hydroxy-5-deazaflavin:NADPH oxidoreductase
MITSIGLIGSGPVARALAHHSVSAGLRVFISNSRGPASLIDIVNKMGDGAQAVNVGDAARADLVILALPFVKVPELADIVPDWSGRVAVATKQFAQYEPTYDGFVDLGEETGSEWVARQLAGATILKAFNAMFASYIRADPRHAEGRQVVFFAGDDDTACAEFAQFVERLGFAPVFLGGLHDGGRMMQLGGPLHVQHVIRQGQV